MRTLLLLALTLCMLPSLSQSHKLRYPLDSTGERYIQGSLRAQFWTRYMDMNPGTTYNGDPVANRVDFSIRRIRLGLESQMAPKLYFYSLFGGNNLNNSTEKTWTFKVLDLNVEYEFAPQFALGIGKTGWDGLSRHLVRSNKSLMTLDAPIFSLLTVNKDDDVGRSMGIWAKGQVGRFDYIMTLKEPATYGMEAQEGNVDFAQGNTKMRTSGYVKYEFLGDEPNTNAYSGAAGTHMGKYNLLNLGAGFLYRPEMTWSLVNGQETRYDFKNWAVELFYDAPINRKTESALTAYLGYFDTDFGPGYIRNVGANDYTEGGTSFNGSGNDFPMMGTGNTWFFQLGMVLPKTIWGNWGPPGKLQPNVAIQYSNFEALNDPMIVYDLGINLFIKGHDNKLSLGYQNRPIFGENSNADLVVQERKGLLVLQYQIEVN